MKRIRVALVVNDLLLGGAQSLVLGILAHLDRTRFEPVLYYLNEYPLGRASNKERFKKAGVEIVYIGTGGKTAIAPAASHLRSLWKQQRPDVVHCHLPDAVISGSIAAISLGIPFIVHEHQSHAMHSLKIKLAFRLIRIFATVTIVYADSLAKELFGSSRSVHGPLSHIDHKNYTIYNGIDIQAMGMGPAAKNRDEVRTSLQISPDDVLIISVARLVEWKGHENLIDAFAVVQQNVPEARLLIVGEGRVASHLSAKISAIDPTGNHIRLLGPRTDVLQLLSAADIFSLVFSYPHGEEGEAIGIASFEAMAASLPTVIGDYPSAHTFIRNGENGVIVRPHDPEALSNAIIRLAKDPEERRRMGERAAESVRFLDWSAMISVYESIYTLLPKRS